MAISNDVIGNGLFAMAAALVAIAYQYFQYRRQLAKSDRESIASAKKKIIEDLISYRFVLTSSPGLDNSSTSRFNAALSAIPVHFSENKDCMDNYRSIGNSFTADKYYELIILLMRDVPLDTQSIDKHLLENVPKR